MAKSKTAAVKGTPGTGQGWEQRDPPTWQPAIQKQLTRWLPVISKKVNQNQVRKCPERDGDKIIGTYRAHWSCWLLQNFQLCWWVNLLSASLGSSLDRWKQSLSCLFQENNLSPVFSNLLSVSRNDLSPVFSKRMIFLLSFSREWFFSCLFQEKISLCQGKDPSAHKIPKQVKQQVGSLPPCTLSTALRGAMLASPFT